MSTNENTSRATDAKLHELLTGAKTFVEPTTKRLLAQPATHLSDNASPVYPVPFYTADLNHVYQAELALAPELREDYACELLNELVDRDDLQGLFVYGSRHESEQSLAYRGIYALITATAAQRAQALVAVLERVRGEVGT